MCTQNTKYAQQNKIKYILKNYNNSSQQDDEEEEACWVFFEEDER